MRLFFTRRNFLTTGVGALVTAAELRGQSEQIPVAGVPVKEFKPRSTVALVAGEDRRKTVYNALVAIEDQIPPKPKTRASNLSISRTRTRTWFRFGGRPHCSMRTPSSSERRC